MVALEKISNALLLSFHFLLCQPTFVLLFSGGQKRNSAQASSSLGCTVRGGRGQMTEVFGNTAREQQPLFSPPKSQLTESAHSHVGWNQLGPAETSQAAVPHSHLGFPWGMLAQHHLGDPFSLLILLCKKQAGEGLFFPPHNEIFQLSHGGKPCHCSPRLCLCCQRLQGTAEIAESRWPASKVTDGVIYQCYRLLQGSWGLKLFLGSLHCFLDVAESGCSLFCCLCSKLLSKISLLCPVRGFASLMEDQPFFLTPPGSDCCLHQLLSVPGSLGGFQTVLL